jgi:hypothetical protein
MQPITWRQTLRGAVTSAIVPDPPVPNVIDFGCDVAQSTNSSYYGWGVKCTTASGHLITIRGVSEGLENAQQAAENMIPDVLLCAARLRGDNHG